jgi:hypothetical protein
MKNGLQNNRAEGAFLRRNFPAVVVLLAAVIFILPDDLHAGRPAATAMTAASYDDVVRFDNLYFTANRWGIEIFEIVNDTDLVSLSKTPTRGRTEFLDVANGLVAAGNIDGLVELFYINGKTLRPAGSIDPAFHPVAVKIIGDYLYVGGLEVSLAVYDISDPRFPEKTLEVDFEGYPHDYIIRNDTLFVAAHHGGVVLLDISEAAHPRLLQQYDLGSYVYGILPEGQYIYVCAHSSGLIVLDMESQNMPPVIGYNGQFGSARKAIMTGEGLLVLDGFGAISMIDVTNPAQPQTLWGQPLEFNSNDFDLDGEFLAVANWIHGLKLYRTDLKSEFTLLDREINYSVCGSIAVEAGRIYVGSGTGGLLTYDHDLSPNDAGEIAVGENCLEVKIDNGYAFLSNGEYGVTMVDISNPDDFKLISTFNCRGWVKSTARSGNMIYLANWQGIMTVDITDVRNPREINFLDTELGTSKIDFRNDTLFVAGSGGLYLYDVSIPNGMSPLGEFRTYYPASGLKIHNDLVFLSSGLGGVDILTLADGLRLISHVDALECASAADYGDGRMFVADGYSGISEWDLSRIDSPVFVGIFLSTGKAVDLKLDGDRLYVADYYGVTMFEVGFNEQNYNDYADLNGINHIKIVSYPNPVNGGANIAFELKSPGVADVSIYDILGRKVRSVFNGYMEAGQGRLSWDSRDVASGCYFITLAGKGFSSSRQVTIIK